LKAICRTLVNKNYPTKKRTGSVVG